MSERDLERCAVALEHIAGALMVLAFDGEDEPETELLACDACPAQWEQFVDEDVAECPECGKRSLRKDGSWLDAPAES